MQQLKFGMGKDALEEYISLKGQLTIENVRDIIGLITASCAEKMEFEIVEYIMKGVVYENRRLRPSFVQEILSASDESKFKKNLEKYLNENHLTIECFFRNQRHKQLKCNSRKDKKGYAHERIIDLNYVDVNDISIYHT